MTVDEALDGLEAGTRAVRALAELGANDGAFLQAMLNLRRDVLELEAVVHRAQAMDDEDED